MSEKLAGDRSPCRGSGGDVPRSKLDDMPPVTEPQTRRTLVESKGISVVDFRCRAHVEPLGPEEPNPTHGIVFVRQGVFRRTQPGEALVADANQVLFFNAGEPYRYAHPLPGGDECTVVVLDGQRALELVMRHAPRDAESPEVPFRLSHGLASARAARLHYELLALVRQGAPKIALEDVVAELADEAVGVAYRRRGVRGERESASATARQRRRELVEAAQLAVNARLERLPSLAELAAELGCSPCPSVAHLPSDGRPQPARHTPAGCARAGLRLVWPRARAISPRWRSSSATPTTATSRTPSAESGECRHHGSVSGFAVRRGSAQQPSSLPRGRRLDSGKERSSSAADSLGSGGVSCRIASTRSLPRGAERRKPARSAASSNSSAAYTTVARGTGRRWPRRSRA